ncbi:hypothetical protein [Rhodopirellula sp. MGV]|uniref:hypothetical protein n=1 Tax=Rhodopirellula sp. MGV TaxID=2023130 RepID=UPI000B977AB6|nr:hypothetical protein [Rhodopirellula sp. MGV]OYP33067.1 hypothetical protein CGZ80_18415 [Rhodopirellula sp. MGV]PNY37979.1 hypothetical protein C2E31_05645 [Rhodopirellula baltica]
MKYFLIATGLLAAIAITCPMLVAVGYLFLIIPGLVLTCAPTVFVYSLATAAIRRVLPIESPWAATTLSLAIALSIGWLVMQPPRMKWLAQFNSQATPDIELGNPLKLDGHVRIELPHRNSDPQCDYLCLALLDCPNVDSVTVVTSSASQQRLATYKLVSAAENTPLGLVPVQPGEIIRKDPGLARKYSGRQFRSATMAVEADWAMRLAGDERLKEVDPKFAKPTDWTIRLEERRHYPTSSLRRVSIVDSEGVTRFRKTFYEQTVPSRFFYFGYRIHPGAGTISGASFHIGRQNLTFGDIEFRPESTLLSTLDRPQVRCDQDAIVELREAVAEALDDPNATDMQLSLANRYLDLFHFDTTETDDRLISRIVVDDRISQLDEVIANVYSTKKTPLRMRDAFAERIAMNHSSPKLRQWLAECLAGMPRGTFADPSATHWLIWKTPELYRDAPAFIESLADVESAEAVAVLAVILDDSVDIEETRQRREVMRAVCQAYTRFGPRASSAIDRIRELFLRRPSPIMSLSKEADMWRVALARMGVPLADLPMFSNQTGPTAERILRRVADQLKKQNHETKK